MLANEGHILLDVCEFIVDCEHKTAPTQESGYPSIRTPNIGRGRLLLDGVNRVSEDTYREWTKRATPKAGDLVLAREAPVGNVALIPPGEQMCLGQRTVLIRPDGRKVDADYLVYLLTDNAMRARLLAATNGATVGHLNVKDIRGLRLPSLPVIATQRKVAAVLSAYDDLIENNVRRIKILEEMAQALYREWFVHFRFPGHEGVRMVESAVGMVPEGWKSTRLGDLAQEVRRGVQPASIPPSTPYVGLEHIPRRSIALTEWGLASDVESTKLLFRKGEILFGKIRPYFHKVAVAPVDGVCSSDAIVIAPKAEEWFPIILGCVSSEEFVNHATLTSHSTKMPRANWDVLVKYPVPLPPSRLLTPFGELIRTAVEQIQNLVLRNRNLRRTRDLLLPKLISGEVDVSDLAIEVGEAA